MLTLQDLRAVPDAQRIDFVRQVINDHIASKAYKEAVTAEAYYNGENVTISRYEKILYDMQGRAHKDLYSANHKIMSKFLGFAVDQENSYLLGNGVFFSNPDTKDRLGKSFDLDIMTAGEYALVGGVSFGFWNLDHLEVFKLTEFCPLYDEETGALSAGVRFWQIDASKPLRATLYEMDGYTDYIWNRRKEDGGREQGAVLHEKRPYKLTYRQSEADGVEILDGENYPSFPIVPLMNGRDPHSELRGRQNTIDALDLVVSNMVNNVDEGSLIYWVLENCGGMDDMDDARFIERLKTVHVAHADGDAGARAVPQSIEAPFEGTQATIDVLLRRLYDDFQCFDSSAVSAGNQTATAIKAAYVPLDLKTDKFEAQVTKFIDGILLLAGIDDEPTYTRNQIINKQEEVSTVLAAAQSLDGEYVTRKILTILGDADQADDILKRMDIEDITKYTAEEEENNADYEGGMDTDSEP